MKILLVGASGLLGTELRKLDETIVHYTHEQLPIEKPVLNWMIPQDVDIIVNCAAVKDNRKIEQNPSEALDTNIVGSVNLAKICIELGIRYVYISTDYIYEGSRGNYLESDPVLPCNLYAWTKLAGEVPARAVKNHLIIRTSFGDSKFDYPVAFTDKWSSKDYVDRIAPLILEAAKSPLVGVLNLGTERKTIYSLASERNEVKPVRLSETSHSTPYDTSLNLQKWLDYKSTKPLAKPHTNCRCCGSDELVKYLDLGLMPLANNLEITSLRAKEVEKFPLQVMYCQNCGLSQLSVVVDPVKMYSYYTYRSSVNGGYIKHCAEMANELIDKVGLDCKSLHIDIAGNDGALLRCFKQETNGRVLNVDPASNLCAIAESNGIESLNAFWGIETANKILKDHGQASLITATNVFAHVDNIHEFLSSVKMTLVPEGILVIECPYLIDFIENLEFNQTYFEHLSIMSLSPIVRLCYEIGLKVIQVSKINIHGGTMRVMIANNESVREIDNSVIEWLDRENREGYLSLSVYKNWKLNVKAVTTNCANKLYDLKKAGSKIAAIAASAKGVTFMCAMGVNTDIIDYICDDTSEKIAKFSPGTGIPILHPGILERDQPDYLLILSENFKDDLAKRARSVGYKGKFIVGLPEFEIFE